MSNLAIDLMPKTLDEVYGHIDKIKQLKSWIREDDYPYLIFVAGDSGTGKGSLVHNFIKTSLCLNRKPGEDSRCGHCAICNMDPRVTTKENNIMWVQNGSGGSTIHQQFKEAETYSNTPPTGNKADYHRFHKFIVYDETQNIQSNLLERLLFSSEVLNVVERNRVTFICITMDEQKIRDKNPQAYNALKSRAGKGYLRLGAPTEKQLHQFAKEKLNISDDYIEVRNALVNYAESSYRAIIAGYEKLNSLACGLDDTASVLSALGFATLAQRHQFWLLYSNSSNKDKNELKAMYDSMCHIVSEYTLIKQLLSDLYNYCPDPPLSMLAAMSEYLKDSTTVATWYIIFIPYIGKVHVNLPGQESSILDL